MQIKDQDGVVVEGDVIGVAESSEPWSEYTLNDGTILKVKFVLGAVFRLKGKWTDDGDPMYITKSQSVVMAIVPDKLKKASGA